MSPADKMLMERKIARLERNITLLEKYHRTPFEDFEKDLTIQGAALHYLVESIEIILDIGNHILAEEFKTNPESYTDIISNLGVHKIVPAKFARENANMAKFRNRIVHVYEEINLKEVYALLEKAPDVFRNFSRHYLKILK